MQRARQPKSKTIVNVGCGPRGHSWLPTCFDKWRLVRVDVDISVEPDIVADATDLSMIETGSVDAVWSAHCIEHIYAHQVRQALSEFCRVLNDTGILCVIVPDLQSIAQYIVSDHMNDAIYQSKAGPVSAHDMLYGFGPALAQGRMAMAHRCGFTPTAMLDQFKGIAFQEVVLRRRKNLELAAVARKSPSRDAADRAKLLAALQL